MKNLPLNRTQIVLDLILVLVSGFLSAFLSAIYINYVYYKPQVDGLNRQISIMNSSLEAQRDQIEIMRQSLERKPNLVLTVIPSCEWRVIAYGNGTVEVRNTTLRVPRTANYTFRIYASNVGDAFAHVLYYAVVFDYMNYTQIEIPSSETTVLKPHESLSFEYVFEPSDLPIQLSKSTTYFSLTFILGSVETTVQKIVLAQFED